MEKLLNLNGAKAGSDASSAYATKAEQVWSMLDDMANNSPDSYKKFIEKTLKEGKESMKPPQAHMCVRTSIRKASEGSKKNLYINFFSWNRIPEPKTDDDPIPVYGRNINFDAPKNLDPFVNVAFSPNILEKYGKNGKEREEREQLIQLAFEFVERQNSGVQINKSDVKMIESQEFYGPSLLDCTADLTRGTNTATSKESGSDLDLAKDALGYLRESGGQLPDSIISKISKLDINKPAETKPLIQEVEEPTDEPSYEAKILKSKSDPDQCFYDLRINLPKVSSINECSLEIEDEKADFLILNFENKTIYNQLKISLVDLKTTYRIESARVEAKFVKKNGTLHVKLPLVDI